MTMMRSHPTDMFTASLEPPAAAQFGDHSAMALRGATLKAERADLMVEPLESAASTIVDSILAPDGPMRSSCDPMGTARLETWRTADDEAMFAMTGDGLLGSAE